MDKSKNSGIKELKNLLDLRGVLSILGYHYVVNAQDAMDVNLKEKCNIKELKMEWGSDFDDPRTERNEMEVLELLQPHRNLK